MKSFLKFSSIVVLMMVSAFVSPIFAGDDKVKVGFIYVGPVGDHGWTYMHDQGRLMVEEELGDLVETTYVESVKYGADAERVITQMAMQGVDIIFATSFGYMDQMLAVAKKFPNVKFEHATGYKTAPNMAVSVSYTHLTLPTK